MKMQCLKNTIVEKSRGLSGGLRGLVLGGVLLVSGGNFAKGQDIHFSQFFETPLLRNPSFGGMMKDDYVVQGIYRNQWNSFTNSFKTGAFHTAFKWNSRHVSGWAWGNCIPACISIMAARFVVLPVPCSWLAGNCKSGLRTICFLFPSGVIRK